MGNREESCEARIAAELATREETARKLLAAQAGDYDEDEDEYNEESIYEFGLGISRRVEIRFDMSTGGPGDWLMILVDPEGWMVEGVTYHFSDWFDHAERRVDPDSKLWELAEWVAESERY